jgi:hypothetical protein
MSYVRHVYLLAYNDVQHILCCVFCFACLHLVSCVDIISHNRQGHRHLLYEVNVVLEMESIVPVQC